MNLIVEKSSRIKWYTDLHPFFASIPSFVSSLTWLWTDIDVTFPIPKVSIDEFDRKWITGESLFEFSNKRPQFVWSVLTPFTSDKLADAKKLAVVPFAEGNSSYWTGSPRPQHPLAEFEIVCWDASVTLLIGANDMLANAFRNAYPETKCLDTRNATTQNDTAR